MTKVRTASRRRADRYFSISAPSTALDARLMMMMIRCAEELLPPLHENDATGICNDALSTGFDDVYASDEHFLHDTRFRGESAT